MQVSKFFSFTLLALAIASCKKQNEAENHSLLSVSLRAANPATVLHAAASNSTGTTLKTAGINLLWTTAKASANLLKFEAEKSGAEVEFKSKVQQTVDLFNANASLGNISIPAATYDEVELKANLSPNGSTPSLEMKGSLTTAGGDIPVIFTVNESIELKGEKKNVTISGAATQDASIAIDFSKLVRGMTASEMESANRTNGAVEISATTNTNLYTKMVKNLWELKAEGEFHR